MTDEERTITFDKQILIDSVKRLEKENAMTFTSDNPAFSKFSTQYVNALVRFHYPDATGTKPADHGIWFARLLDYGCQIENWNGDLSVRDALDFWNELREKKFRISLFNITSATFNYIPVNPNSIPPPPAGATYQIDVTGNIEYVENNSNPYDPTKDVSYKAIVTVRHYIRPTWVAVKTWYRRWDLV